MGISYFDCFICNENFDEYCTHSCCSNCVSVFCGFCSEDLKSKFEMEDGEFKNCPKCTTVLSESDLNTPLETLFEFVLNKYNTTKEEVIKSYKYELEKNNILKNFPKEETKYDKKKVKNQNDKEKVKNQKNSDKSRMIIKKNTPSKKKSKEEITSKKKSDEEIVVKKKVGRPKKIQIVCN